MVGKEPLYGDDHLLRVEGLDQIAGRAQVEEPAHHGPSLLALMITKGDRGQVGIVVEPLEEFQPVHLGTCRCR
jgi:hypothetical protein